MSQDKTDLEKGDPIVITNLHLNNFEEKLIVESNNVDEESVEVQDGMGSTTYYFYEDFEIA